MSKLNDYGYKLKQLSIPMDLYHRILKRCGEEDDHNETRVMLKLIKKGLTLPIEIDPDRDIPEIATLFPDDEGDRGQPEVIRLRNIFPDNELEVERQLSEIAQGLRDVGESEENIRLILYGSEEKDE